VRISGKIKDGVGGRRELGEDMSRRYVRLPTGGFWSDRTKTAVGAKLRQLRLPFGHRAWTEHRVTDSVGAACSAGCGRGVAGWCCRRRDPARCWYLVGTWAVAGPEFTGTGFQVTSTSSIASTVTAGRFRHSEGTRVRCEL